MGYGCPAWSLPAVYSEWRSQCYDSLYGSTGNDILEGGAGNDTLSGDADSDVYRFSRGWGQDTVNNNDSSTGKVDAMSAIHEPHLPPDGASIYRCISGEQFHGSSAS
ncbi:hypothetical protein HU766_24580 [Pseudomonas sp. SWRI77]|nr:hypothetical protein [Pseudomonas sp. SWRI77]